MIQCVRTLPFSIALSNLISRQGLGLRRLPRPCRPDSLRIMHVFGYAPDKRFVHLKNIPFAADLARIEGMLFQGLTDAVKHEPCGLLRNAKHPAQFVRADSVLARHEHPHCRHPLIKTKGRVFHDRFHLDRELPFAGITEPKATGLDKRELPRGASRAANVAVWPAQFDGVIEGSLRICEAGDCFLECARLLHVKHYNLNAHVCQVIYYLFIEWTTC